MNTQAKLLLFGEHIIIQGANALAYPWDAYQAEWRFGKEATSDKEDASLQNWLAYLKELQKTDGGWLALDLDRFEQDLQDGLYFHSNIPRGYGAGSSGALCAGLFKRYRLQTAALSFSELKEQFGKMESFFHGSSSGTDPLICYLNRSLLIQKSLDITLVELDLQQLPKPYQLFVLNTGIERQTEPWVNYFLRQAANPNFQGQMNSTLIPASNQAIQALLNYDGSQLFQQMAHISKFQYEHLREMIPETFHNIWATGLADNSDFKLKLCGAGGGGFILGLSRDPKALTKLQKAYTLLTLQ